MKESTTTTAQSQDLPTQENLDPGYLESLANEADHLPEDFTQALLDAEESTPLEMPASAPNPAQQGQGNQAQPQARTAHRLKKTKISVIKGREFPVDCIDGILPQSGVAVLGGASGDGKTFIMLDIAASIALKKTWFGRKIFNRRPIVYFYLENPDGLKQRILAWEKQNAPLVIDDDTGINFYESTLDMATDVEELAVTMPQFAIVIIDTLRKANPGENENTPEGMGKILARMKTLCELRRDLLIVVVHHVPKKSEQPADNRNKLAGHYSLPADTDAVMLTERKGDSRTLWIGKVRENEDGIGFSYALRKHQVGTRPQDGKPVTSLAVEWIGYPTANQRMDSSVGKPERYARLALLELQHMTASNLIDFDEWKDKFVEMYANDNPRKENQTEAKYIDNIRKYFYTAKDKLLEKCIKLETVIGVTKVRITKTLD